MGNDLEVLQTLCRASLDAGQAIEFVVRPPCRERLGTLEPTITMSDLPLWAMALWQRRRSKSGYWLLDVSRRLEITKELKNFGQLSQLEKKSGP